jgi:hypothetical protein
MRLFFACPFLKLAPTSVPRGIAITIIDNMEYIHTIYDIL